MADGLAPVFLENRAALLRFLRARGAGEDAEDLLQDLWMKIDGRDFDGIDDPLSYLYRMANNLMLDRYRSMSRRERREQDWVDSSGGVMAESADLTPVDEQLIAAQRLKAASAALRDLGPRAELVFRRFRVEGIGQKTIAQQLGVSLTTVEKDLQKAYRALAALRKGWDTE